MTGFSGLAQKKFGGDVKAAKNWVADLGRACYFCNTRPRVAASILIRYYDKFPHLVKLDEQGNPYDTNLKYKVF